MDMKPTASRRRPPSAAIAQLVSVRSSRRRAVLTTALVLLSASAPTSAVGNTSHAGWPKINGMLLINKTDSSRILDARAGNDPFGGTDPQYLCDAVHLSQSCFDASADCAGTRDRRGRCDRLVVVTNKNHNELLGGHGDDTIYAGANGDVLWGDYKPSGQPSTQVDHMLGGAGADFIYASHGRNVIDAGAGNDTVKAHFGRGTIDCGSGTDVLFVSRAAQGSYVIKRCERVTHRTIGY